MLFMMHTFTLFFQDPKMYVNTILEVHKKYNSLVLTAFNNDSGFVAALDKACGKFINSNSVTRYAFLCVIFNKVAYGYVIRYRFFLLQAGQ